MLVRKETVVSPGRTRRRLDSAWLQEKDRVDHLFNLHGKVRLPFVSDFYCSPLRPLLFVCPRLRRLGSRGRFLTPREMKGEPLRPTVAIEKRLCPPPPWTESFPVDEERPERPERGSPHTSRSPDWWYCPPGRAITDATGPLLSLPRPCSSSAKSPFLFSLASSCSMETAGASKRSL